MDARLFFGLAVARGFVEPVLLTGDAATCAAVRGALLEMADVSEPGDLFLLTFSGHGGRTRLPAREVGTWQLYDGTLNDEQLCADLGMFRQGVRVVVVSDNCGGGLPMRRRELPVQRSSPQSPGGLDEKGHPLEPFDSLDRRSAPGALSRPAIEGFLKASVLVLAACQEHKHADGPGLPGHFAAAMSRVLNSTNFNAPYDAFYEALCNDMPPYQRPDYYRLGPPDAAFEAQPPFTI